MAMTQEQRERLLALRATMDASVANAAEDTAALNTVADFVRPWKPGSYSAGDVRMYENIPYKCVQAHDSTENPDWYPPAVPALWMQYHGTSRETARPWVSPTGAHDQYLAGEWMIYTDGETYECLSNTVYAPDAYPAAWRKYEP